MLGNRRMQFSLYQVRREKEDVVTKVTVKKQGRARAEGGGDAEQQVDPLLRHHKLTAGMIARKFGWMLTEFTIGGG